MVMIVITILSVVMMFVFLSMILRRLMIIDDTMFELIYTVRTSGVVEEREHCYHKYVLNIPEDIRRCDYCQKQSREALRDLMEDS